MKTVLLFLIALISLISIHMGTYAHSKQIKQGVIIVPVADLIGERICTQRAQDTHGLGYSTLPAATGPAPHTSSCLRLHQVLFNELVNIMEETADEIRISVPNVFYLTSKQNDTQINTNYWTKRENIAPLEKLKTLEVHIKNIRNIKEIKDIKDIKNLIPEPISFLNPASITHQNVIALTEPFYDTVTNNHFSVGTRFVLTPQQNSSGMFTVYLIDWNKKQATQTNIPESHALKSHTLSKSESIQTFLSLIKKWSNQTQGLIPYVWGGCSITHKYPRDSHTTTTMTQNEHAITYFNNQAHNQLNKINNHDNKLINKSNNLDTKINKKTNTQAYDLDHNLYNNFNTKNTHEIAHESTNNSVKTGTDCSGLIVRAAQLSGIPYFYKNTATLVQKLKTLAQHEKIESGDLLWIPGHVMIVGDLHKHTLFEARHYIEGFGCIHEIPLSQSFKDIKTYAQLIQRFHDKKPLERLHRNGSVSKKITQFKILKLKSVWD